MEIRRNLTNPDNNSIIFSVPLTDSSSRPNYLSGADSGTVTISHYYYSNSALSRVQTGLSSSISEIGTTGEYDITISGIQGAEFSNNFNSEYPLVIKISDNGAGIDPQTILLFHDKNYDFNESIKTILGSPSDFGSGATISKNLTDITGDIDALNDVSLTDIQNTVNTAKTDITADIDALNDITTSDILNAVVESYGGDDWSIQDTFQLTLAMVNGNYTIANNEVTFYKRDGATVAFKVNITDSSRTKTVSIV